MKALHSEETENNTVYTDINTSSKYNRLLCLFYNMNSLLTTYHSL